MNQIRHLAIPPIFEDEARTYAAQLLHWCLIVLTLTEIVAIGLVYLSEGFNPALLAAIFLNGVTFTLLHQRHLATASLLFVIVMWLILTLNALNNGVTTPSVSVFVVIIILSSILLPERTSVVVAVTSIFSVITLYLAERSGILVLSEPAAVNSTSVLSVHLTVFVTAATLLYFTNRRVRLSLKNLRRSEYRLAERNRQLEQQIAEREQAEAERDRMFDLSLDMMAIAGFDGYFKRLNPAFEKTTGFTNDELLARPYIQFVHPEDVQLTLDVVENIKQENHGSLYENRCLYKDGQYRWIAWTVTAADNHLYVVGRDVSEQKRAEIRERELALAKEKSQFLTEFLGTISHDLKTPLTIINTSLYLLERLQDPATQARKIQQIKEQTGLVEKFIQDILTVTRLDHLPALQLSPVDLNILLTATSHQLRAKAETKAIVLRLDLMDDVPKVLADYDQLQRAFTNLVENALNYTPNAGNIDVRTCINGDWLTVEIADTGIGIQDKDLPHIFERFYRSNEARSLEGGGTGLGLAIVKKIMDMHGYEILVLSSAGQGTTFRAQIPIETPAAS